MDPYDDGDWKPPSEAELKELARRRERGDKVLFSFCQNSNFLSEFSSFVKIHDFWYHFLYTGGLNMPDSWYISHNVGSERRRLSFCQKVELNLSLFDRLK